MLLKFGKVCAKRLRAIAMDYAALISIRRRKTLEVLRRRIIRGAALQRAFLARRRGHGGAVERKILIRDGGLKTCWTKPQASALPQLWALQLGKAFRARDERPAKGRDRGFARVP